MGYQQDRRAALLDIQMEDFLQDMSVGRGSKNFVNIYCPVPIFKSEGVYLEGSVVLLGKFKRGR
jgi:hypothetical protein